MHYHTNPQHHRQGPTDGARPDFSSRNSFKQRDLVAREQRQLNAGTGPFPSVMFVTLRWTWWTKRILDIEVTEGAGANFVAELHNRRPNIILRPADAKSSPLAVVSSSSSCRIGASNQISISTGGGPNVDEMLNGSSSNLGMSSHWAFAVNVGPPGQEHREEFEWRPSRGAEVKDLNSARGRAGRKLVRLGARRGPGGSRDERADGETSDGCEVVAVWAGANSLHFTKVGRLQFLNSGASGELGEKFHVMAVASALRIWDVLHQRNNRAAATTSVVTS